MTEIINDIIGLISSLASSNPVIFYGVLAVLAFLIYRRPMFFLVVLAIALLVAGVVYIIMEMASSGLSEKRRLIDRKAPVENVCRHPRLNL